MSGALLTRTYAQGRFTSANITASKEDSLSTICTMSQRLSRVAWLTQLYITMQPRAPACSFVRISELTNVVCGGKPRSVSSQLLRQHGAHAWVAQDGVQKQRPQRVQRLSQVIPHDPMPCAGVKAGVHHVLHARVRHLRRLQVVLQRRAIRKAAPSNGRPSSLEALPAQLRGRHTHVC